jgi:hypothetical protein
MVSQTARTSSGFRQRGYHRSLRRMTLRMMRPSLLDLRFRGDSWLVDRQDGTFSLLLGDFCLASIPGVPFDLHSMNQTVDRMRHSKPRPAFKRN